MSGGKLPLKFKLLSALYNRAAVSKDTTFADLCELWAMTNVALDERVISPSEHKALTNLYSRVRREAGLYKVNPQPTSLFTRYLTALFTFVYSSRVESTEQWKELAGNIDLNQGYLGPGEYDTLVQLLNKHSVEIENAVYLKAGHLDSVSANTTLKHYADYDLLKKQLRESCRFRYLLLDEERDYFLTVMEMALDCQYITAAQYSNLWDTVESATEQRRSTNRRAVSPLDLGIND